MFDRIIKENQFKTNCVIALYVLIFTLIGLLVDIVRINANTLGGGFYSLLTLQEFPLVTLTLFGIAFVIVLFTISNFKQILLSGSEYKEVLAGSEASAQEKNLTKMLDELVAVVNLPFRPKLYIMDAPYMNAFASG